ncbi:diguanylate cyclase (GGDEF) domain-containing protein [Lachnospiraceae bacterium RM5]|nr:diguanylate cyclase (GGDEF) domain-containing protein [Lachnospiraceae bacterium RM5]
MRIHYSIIFAFLITALFVCAVQALRSDKEIKKDVFFLELAFIPPVVGNLLIISSDIYSIALVGHYCYYIGMDLVMFALVNFTNTYCNETGKKESVHKPTSMYIILILDAIQMGLNIVYGHAFKIKAIDIDNRNYYRVVPLFGQTIHRIVDYFIFFCVILIFIMATVKSLKFYRERYIIILISMSVVAIFQTYFIFSQSPIDRSMAGYAVFGIIIYYFSINFRSRRLLDRVLSDIVSKLSDAFYILDPDRKCIWSNEQGYKLFNLDINKKTSILTDKVNEFFKDGNKQAKNKQDLCFRSSINIEDEIHYFELEESYVRDDNGHTNGIYLRVHDITNDELEKQMREKQYGKISREAYKDALTSIGNKSAYNREISKLNERIKEGLKDFAVVMADINDLKKINDEHGHKMGDMYIKGCCHLICDVFKHSPVFRIGGDEFVVILTGNDFMARKELVKSLRAAYKKAYENNELADWEKYSASVGIAEYASDDDSYELVFKRADKHMYEEKKAFKEKCGSYR